MENSGFSNLPGIAQAAIVVGGIGASVGLFFAGRKFIRKQKAQKKAKETQAYTSNDAAVFEAKGIKQSFPDNQYNAWGDFLYSSMKGAGTSNVPALYAIFGSLKNIVDVYKLITAFGIRDGESLNQWIGGEYRIDIPTINKNLQAKGINYQF